MGRRLVISVLTCLVVLSITPVVVSSLCQRRERVLSSAECAVVHGGYPKKCCDENISCNVDEPICADLDGLGEVFCLVNGYHYTPQAGNVEWCTTVTNEKAECWEDDGYHKCLIVYGCQYNSGTGMCTKDGTWERDWIWMADWCWNMGCGM